MFLNQSSTQASMNLENNIPLSILHEFVVDVITSLDKRHTAIFLNFSIKYCLIHLIDVVLEDVS